METVMSYKTLMVHLELNGDNDGVLKVAADLAGRFQAKVIGIAACQPIPPLYETGMYPQVLIDDRAAIARDLEAVEAQFRAALAGRVESLDWRTSVTFSSLADFIAEEARAADLIITGRDIGASLLDNTRRVNIADLVMRAGRPLLIVPQGISALPLANVFLGWKDSREARRAAMDALPLLGQAKKLTVLEVTNDKRTDEAHARVNDVVGWLERHQVSATPAAISAPQMEMTGFGKVLREAKCDLLVAGAYGHNRLGEWVFGGVTSDFLLDPDFCVLISH